MSLAEIRSRLSAALARAGRPLDSTVLIAVSKLQPAERILGVIEAGHRVFGENRVQEADMRWPPLREAFGGIDLHLVGPLQTNKARRAVELFDAIHSLDRDRLARRVAEAVQAVGHCPRIFVQVNTGREPQKAGIDPGMLDDFLIACRDDYDLAVEGLMALPPADEDPAPHFAALRDMAVRNGLEGLSMGMSADFELAVAHGATHVRVGSAIFGARGSS